MQIHITPTLPNQPGSPARQLTLAVGQLLNARVIGKTSGNSIELLVSNAATAAKSTGSLPPNTIINAKIAGSLPAPSNTQTTGSMLSNVTITAKTTASLPTNEPLLLKVIAVGKEIVLERQSPSAPTQPTSVQSQALRLALPRQGPIAPLLNQLASAATSSPDRDLAPLPTPIAHKAETIYQKLPEGRTLTTPRELYQAVRDSGLFLESRLAQAIQTGNPQPPQFDFKWELLHLAALIRKVRADSPESQPKSPADTTKTPPPEARIAHQIDNALARIQVNQLNALPNASENPSVLYTEIPVRDGDRTNTMPLTISRDGRSGEDPSTARWSASLSLDLGAAGMLHARLWLHDDTIGIGLWAENPQTAAHLDAQLPLLGTGLQAAGLPHSELTVHHGKPVTRPDSQPERLIQVKI